MGQIFTIILVNPIINILVAIYQVLLELHIPSPLGFAIILLTVCIRLVLYPMTASQLRASKKMQAIAPHLSRLKEKHKGDAKRLQEEQMKLYKEHGVNPAAGCLPLIIQFPVIIALYSVLQRVVGAKQATIVSDINKILYFPSLHLSRAWDQHFFGIPLGLSPAKLIPTLGFSILLIPIVTAALQFVQSKMMFGGNTGKTESAKETHALVVVKDTSNKKPEEKKGNDDFAKAMQTQTLYMIPVLIGISSYNFPFGLSLYWNTFTIFGIIQQYQIQGFGGLVEWKKYFMRRK